jgi:hypothetical protein
MHHHQLLEQTLEEKFNTRFEALNQTLNEKMDLVNIIKHYLELRPKFLVYSLFP